MISSLPKPPFSVSPAQIDEGPIFLVVDANDQIITTSFEVTLAGFVAGKLNHRCDDKFNDPIFINPLVASMLCAFRLHLEHENGGPVTDDPTMALLMADLCDWFALNTGERALALGPDWLGLIDRLNHEPPLTIEDVAADNDLVMIAPQVYVARG